MKKVIVAVVAALGLVAVPVSAGADEVVPAPVPVDCASQGDCPPKPNAVVVDELDWVLSCEGYQERVITGTTGHELVFLNNAWQWVETDPSYTVSPWVFSSFDDAPRDTSEFDCDDAEKPSSDDRDVPSVVDVVAPVESVVADASYFGVRPTIN